MKNEDGKPFINTMPMIKINEPMKTTMQQLIERLKRNVQEMPNEQNTFTQGYKAGLYFVIKCATNSLEKEKQQIIEAVNYGNRQDLYDETEFELSNYYYNQTYNENK